MSKLIVMSMVVVMTAGLAICGGQGRMGAVKTGLYERQAGDDPTGAGSGDWVGFAVVNTDCEGMLSANVVVKGLPEGTYDVYLKVDGSGHKVGTIAIGENGHGQAKVMWEVGTAVEKGETVSVQVVVKQGAGGAIVGSATATVDVALKLACDEMPE